ncbi:MAG: tetrahydrofolate dehydrogenase/cyclohydrolase catalytic domain-containing protein, partial [Candidatus Paceibacteria bacterium]
MQPFNPIKKEVVHHFHDTPKQLAPHLVIIMIGYDSASATYIQKKKEFLEEIGGRVTIQRFPKKASEEEIVEYIQTCNDDPDVDGIIVQLPVPHKYHKDVFLDTIDAPKDVDGLSTFNLGSLFYGSQLPFFWPATVRAVTRMLGYYNYTVYGSHVVLVGAGILVSQPLYHILTEWGASVTTVHKDTPNLSEITQHGDFIIS